MGSRVRFGYASCALWELDGFTVDVREILMRFIQHLPKKDQEELLPDINQVKPKDGGSARAGKVPPMERIYDALIKIIDKHNHWVAAGAGRGEPIPHSVLLSVEASRKAFVTLTPAIQLRKAQIEIFRTRDQGAISALATLPYFTQDLNQVLKNFLESLPTEDREKAETEIDARIKPTNGMNPYHQESLAAAERVFGALEYTIHTYNASVTKDPKRGAPLDTTDWYTFQGGTRIVNQLTGVSEESRKKHEAFQKLETGALGRIRTLNGYIADPPGTLVALAQRFPEADRLRHEARIRAKIKKTDGAMAKNRGGMASARIEEEFDELGKTYNRLVSEDPKFGKPVDLAKLETKEEGEKLLSELTHRISLIAERKAAFHQPETGGLQIFQGIPGKSIRSDAILREIKASIPAPFRTEIDEAIATMTVRDISEALSGHLEATADRLQDILYRTILAHNEMVREGLRQGPEIDPKVLDSTRTLREAWEHVNPNWHF